MPHKTEKQKKQKGYKFTEKVKELHAKKQTFWSQATGGRMY
jgi:hypothetical protein